MSVCQNSSSRTAAFLGALAMASLAGLSTASAAVPGFPKLYESVKSVTCTDLGFCVASFQTVPTGQSLVATNLICSTATLGAPPDEFAVYRIFETKLGTVPIQKALFPVLNVIAGSGTAGEYAFNEQIRLSFRSSFIPKISFQVDGTFDTIGVQCTLSGDLS